MSQQKAKVEQIAQETTDFLFEQSTPQIHITNVQERQLETMKTAVYELQAYYGKNLSETVSKIHLEGQDAPWKPATDNHYCIDPIEYVEENKQRQLANLNYCRSSATYARDQWALQICGSTPAKSCVIVCREGYSMGRTNLFDLLQLIQLLTRKRIPVKKLAAVRRMKMSRKQRQPTLNIAQAECANGATICRAELAGTGGLGIQHLCDQQPRASYLRPAHSEPAHTGLTGLLS